MDNLKQTTGRLSQRLGVYNLTLHITISFIALIIVAIAFLSLVFYRYNVHDLEQISIDNTKLLLSEVNYNIDSYIDNVKSMGQVIVDNNDVRQLISFYNKHKLSELSEQEQAELKILETRASAHMKIVANTREEITNIALVPKYGEPVLSDTDKKVNPFSEYSVQDWFLKPLAHSETVYVSPSHVQNLIEGEYRWVISISEVITDPQTNEVIGVMLIDLDYSAIEDICNKAQMGKGSYTYIIDNNGNIISHPQQQLVYSGIRSEPIEDIVRLPSGGMYLKDNKIYIKSHSETTDWSSVGIIDSGELPGNRSDILVFYLLVTVFTILTVIIIAVLISSAVTAPIGMLKEDMDKVRLGDLTVRSKIKSRNEIGDLSDSFNVMISQIQNLMDKTISTEKEKRDSEIKALQSQINPHFLYNTLDTIIWLSASGKNEEVMEVTSALADLFRTSISQGKNFVPIFTEIENIENYLVIQKTRYKDRLNYTIEVDSNATKLFTPKLLLQPIVENALYHGIKLSPNGGEVKIQVLLQNDDLVYIVSDNGVGMDKETVAKILAPNQISSNSIGVLNVHNRIQLLFGERYGLKYSLPKTGGTTVEIRIPAISEGGDYTA